MTWLLKQVVVVNPIGHHDFRNRPDVLPPPAVAAELVAETPPRKG
jgi:hypothetical protein